jgi:hypothetical protein
LKNGSLAPARPGVWRAGSGGSFRAAGQAKWEGGDTQMPAKKKAAKKSKKGKKK